MRLDILYSQYSELTHWTYDQLGATFWRLYLVSQTGATIIHQGRDIALQPHTLMLIPSNTPFSSQLLRPISKLYIHFRFIDEEHNAVAQPIALSMTQSDSVFAQRLRDALPHQQKSPESSLLAMAWIADVLSRLDASVWINQQRHPALTRVIHHLEHICSFPPDVPGMAQLAGMSTRNWQRLCRQETGMGPREFAMTIRLSTVANQLVHTTDSLEKIATDNRFCDRYHLT